MSVWGEGERTTTERIPDLEERTSRWSLRDLPQQEPPRSENDTPRMKPVRPGSYRGHRNEISVDTWLFQMHQYFEICYTNEITKVPFASSLLKDNAGIW